MFEFKAPEAGVYSLLVQHCGVSLPGCPIPITVHGRAAAPHLPLQCNIPKRVKAGVPASIHIDCPACPRSEQPAVLVSMFRSASHAAEHSSAEEPVSLEVEVGRAGEYRAPWLPVKAGYCQVEVLAPGSASTCSRLVQVVPGAVDALKCEVVVRL